MTKRWLVCALLGTAACGDAREHASAVLITLDTTRADALSCYGNARATTPALDRLAAEGVLFESAHTVTALTLPAHASMLTGLDPLRHGIRDNGVALLPPAAHTLAEAAAAAGLDTAAFVSSVVLDPAFGLDQGFRTYDAPARAEAEGGHGAERRAAATIDAALAWLGVRERERPFFLWVHLYDPHHEYAPPPPYDREFADQPYLGEVASMDHELGRLLDALRADGTLERAFVLVLADHGEAFGEHGESVHGAYCYEPTLRIPMIARWPAAARRAGERSGEIVSAVDAAPTLAEAMDLAPLTDVDGLSFFRAPIPAERGQYFESYYGYLTYGWSPLTGWLDARGKYLHSSVPEFYDWRADPGELHDLAAARAGELDLYRRAIAGRAARPALELVEAGADVNVAGIQALGYAGAGEGAGELPDALAPSTRPSPQSQSGFFAEHLRAQRLHEAGRFEEAARVYEEILRGAPGNFLAMDELASERLNQGKLEEGVALLRQVVALGPQRGRPYFKLGLALRRNGKAAEAVEPMQRALELTHGNALYVQTLAELLRELGRADEARALEERYPAR